MAANQNAQRQRYGDQKTGQANQNQGQQGQQGGQGDQGNQGGQNGQDNQTLQALAQVANVVQKLNERVDTMQSQFTETMQNMQNAQSQQAQQSQQDQEEDVDLERLDRNQFADLLLNRVGKMMENQLKSVNEKLGNVEQTAMSQVTKDEIRQLAAEHPDLKYWGEDIKAKMQERPELSVTEAYHIVKGANPDKADEIAEKMAEERHNQSQQNSNSGNGGDQNAKFGGLTPTSGAQTEQPSNMDHTSAADAAWQQTMASIEGIEDLPL